MYTVLDSTFMNETLAASVVYKLLLKGGLYVLPSQICIGYFKTMVFS